MAANVTAQLGLVISASDKASPVFAALARNIMESFAGIQSEASKIGESMTGIGRGANVEEAVNGIAQVGEESESTGKKISKIGGLVSSMAKISAWQDLGARATHVGEMFTGMTGSVINSGATFQQKVDAISATLNNRLAPSAQLTGQQIQALNDKALKLGEVGFYSANEIADGMYTLARQGIGYNDIYGGAMDSIQNLAKATDSDLTSTANVVSDITHEMHDSMVSAFGKDVKDQFNGTANMISGAMHNARISMDDFLSSLKMAGPQASTMGMSIKDVSTSIALLGEHGIKGSQAGTTLRRMLTNLAAPTKAVAKEMENLGIIVNGQNQLFDQTTGKLLPFTQIQGILHDKLQGLSAAQQEMALKTMFGQYALSGMNVITQASTEGVKALSKEVTDSGTAAKLAGDKYNNVSGHLAKFKAHFATIEKSVGEQLLPTFDKLLSLGDRLLNWFDKLSPGTQKFLGMAMAMVGGLGLVSGKVMGTIANFGMMKIAFGSLIKPAEEVAGNGGKVVGVFGRIAGMFSVSSLAFAGILLVIAAVGVGLYELYKHSETFRNGVNAAFKGVVDFVKKELYPPVIEIFGKIKDFIAAVMPDIMTIITTVMKVIGDFWKSWWPVTSAIVTFVVRDIVANIKVFVDTLLGVIRIFLALLSGDWSGAWNGLKTMVWNVINDILSIFGTSGDKLYDAGVKMIKGFINGFKSIKIELPHFSLNPNFSLSGLLSGAQKLSDAINVQWYAKGGIFNSPQVIGVGESGSEAVIPLNKLHDIMNPENAGHGIPTGSNYHRQQINNITVNVKDRKDNGLANDIAKQVRLQLANVNV